MMQWQFPSNRRSAHPVAQMLAGVLGIVVIVGVGLFALGAAAILVVGLATAFAVRRLLSPSSPASGTFRARADPPESRMNDSNAANVIDGEFVVVDPAHSRAKRPESD